MSITEIPLVEAYRVALQTALNNTAYSEKPVPSQVVVDTFQQVREQTGLPEDKTITQSAIENVVREKFVSLVSSIDDIHRGDSASEELWKLIDITNRLSQSELSEPSLAFYLIEELMDSQTIDGCRKVFDYLESRREEMVRINFKMISLVILRCCNELLRRLSRAEETVFCGRVFIYLFQTFPLGDRSSVNLRGVFHTENVTVYDETFEKSDDVVKPMEIDSEAVQTAAASAAPTPSSTGLEVDNKPMRGTTSARPPKPDTTKSEPPPDLDTLYPIFWSLQGLFSDPTRLFTPQSMQEFKDGMAQSLSCFRHVSKTAPSASEPVDVKRGLKRKRDQGDSSSTTGNANGYSTPMDDENTAAEASKFNPKYLTSRDLFDLEIHDMAFRRHFLVQALIMLDFLLSLSASSKQKTLGLANRSVLYAHTLSEEDLKWCQATRTSIALYLQQSGIGTEGSLYYRMVDTVLSRDKNWARWKAESCPAISRPCVPVETYISAQKSLQTLSRLPPMINPPGANDFDFLGATKSLESLKDPGEQHQPPSLQAYYDSIQADDLDLDFAVDEQEKADIEEKKAGKLWRALRSAPGKRFVLCEQLDNGKNVGALIGKAPEKVNGKEANGTKAESANDVNVKMEDDPDEVPDEEPNADKAEGTENTKKEEEVDDEGNGAAAIDQKSSVDVQMEDENENAVHKAEQQVEDKASLPDAPDGEEEQEEQEEEEAKIKVPADDTNNDDYNDEG